MGPCASHRRAVSKSAARRPMRRAGADWASSPREGAWRLLQLLSVEETCIERLHLAAVHVSNSRYGPDWGHACHPGHARHPCIVSIQQTVAQLLVWGEGGSECAPRSSVLTCTLMALLDLDESGVALLNFREGRRAHFCEDDSKSPFSIQAGVIMFLFHENIRCILVIPWGFHASQPVPISASTVAAPILRACSSPAAAPLFILVALALPAGACRPSFLLDRVCSFPAFQLDRRHDAPAPGPCVAHPVGICVAGAPTGPPPAGCHNHQKPPRRHASAARRGRTSGAAAAAAGGRLAGRLGRRGLCRAAVARPRLGSYCGNSAVHLGWRRRHRSGCRRCPCQRR